MTTLVAFLTHDVAVMGCDSLGTVAQPFIDPRNVLSFFDLEQGGVLRKDSDGEPVLKKFSDIYQYATTVPTNHMSHVDKLFELEPIPMAVMMTGSTTIGSRTVDGLIQQFIKNKCGYKKKPTLASGYTAEGIAKRLYDFLKNRYDEAYGESYYEPPLELLLSGFDAKRDEPQLFRIDLQKAKNNGGLEIESGPGIFFAGQMREIQRMVFGTDGDNRLNIAIRYEDLVSLIRDELVGDSASHPTADDLVEKYRFWGRSDPSDPTSPAWSLDGFRADWGAFSPQNAIDCVNWLVGIMVNSQRFSSEMPRVGGDVHIALIRRDSVQFISREEYRHEEHAVPKLRGR